MSAMLMSWVRGNLNGPFVVLPSPATIPDLWRRILCPAGRERRQLARVDAELWPGIHRRSHVDRLNLSRPNPVQHLPTRYSPHASYLLWTERRVLIGFRVE